ncbi:3-deoxy-D-manno-octulosonic acid transferase [Desulfogranum mediterraneum]|uniref:3-deoxy-D-manno-octulosonic acid transferase n=1 Tax=Desulfogranum mediterraneum TaxID=160661 RepID=UPI0013782DF7|nr:glycosyltransferase N-terminal domain-containing protein [Desulfogranum mediterraneum]
MVQIFYSGYGLLGLAGLMVLRLLRPLLRRLPSRYSHGLDQRLDGVPQGLLAAKNGQQRLWVHASSVGEVQAALIILEALAREVPGLQYLLTTTTEQGNKVARLRLGEDIPCLMAPLDVPLLVRKSLERLQPDLYICLETELWPAMLRESRRSGVPVVVLNGRISQRSFLRYSRVAGLMSWLLQGVAGVAAIGQEDGRRFIGLGVAPARVRVCGNVKSAAVAPPGGTARAHYRRLLQLNREQVFICGSTHRGEEALLLQVYQQLAACRPVVWLLAPRHLERLAEVAELLYRAGIGFDYYSTLEKGGQRGHAVVLIDTMGELAELYSVGAYNFCGGSLVDQGGHNIMEAVRWGRPVYYGSSMADFQGPAAQLEAAGCGFRVEDGEALAALLLHHQTDRKAYQAACLQAEALKSGQTAIVQQQLALVKELLQPEA